MIRTIIVLIILSICIIGGYYVQTLPYYVRIYDTAAGSFVQTPFLAWVLLSLACAFVLGLCFKILWFIWRSPKIFSRSAKNRQEHQADRLLKQGLEAMATGDYARAEKKLAKGGQLAEKTGHNPVLYYENAAIAADRQNADARRDNYFQLARHKAERKDSRLTQITEAETLIANNDCAAAVNLLKPLQQKDPRNSKVTVLLDDCYAKLEHWQDAWKNLSKLRNILTPTQFQAKQKTYARAMLKDTAAIETYEQLMGAWRQLPADIRGETSMIIQYASSLVENGHAEEAEKLLANQIRAQSGIELVQAYSQLRGINFQRALSTLKGIENRFPNSAAFQYAKALIAYRAGDYDTAGNTIESSLMLQKTPEAFALWGQILEARNQPEAALAAYRESVSAQLNAPISGELLPAPEKTAQISQQS